MKSITVQLKVNIVNQIEGIKEDGLEFTGLYVDESNTDFTDIAIMYEEDGVENGDIWEIQGDELVIVEYGAFDSTPVGHGCYSDFEEICLDDLEVK